jgi:hypothetical protein
MASVRLGADCEDSIVRILMSMGGDRGGKTMWLTPKQARLITGMERYQLRKSGRITARKWQNMWLYDVADVYPNNGIMRNPCYPFG